MFFGCKKIIKLCILLVVELKIKICGFSKPIEMLEEKIFKILNRNTHYLVKKINLLNINGIVLNFAEDILEAVIKTQPKLASLPPPTPLIDYTRQIIHLPRLGEKKLNFAQSIQN